jgi:hypothetical protein
MCPVPHAGTVCGGGAFLFGYDLASEKKKRERAPAMQGAHFHETYDSQRVTVSQGEFRWRVFSIAD